MTFLTLNIWALLVALVIGALLLIMGGSLGVFFLAVMVYFLVISAIVTHIGHAYKRSSGFSEKHRGVKNVIANGLWPLVLILVYLIIGIQGLPGRNIVVAGFMAGVAAVAADKFSSEIGVLNGMPRSIIGLKKVDKGISGGITMLGLGSGLLGGFLIAAASVALYGGALGAVPMVVAATIGGFSGTLFDSILGFFEERGVGNKFTSNFFASVLGSVVGMLVWLLLVAA